MNPVAPATPDRTIAPGFHKIDRIAFPTPRSLTLDNGIPAWLIDAGSQEVVKIEFQFAAGSRFQQGPLIASAANAMLNGGTVDHTADQLAEQFDFYGAYIQLEATQDFASLSLFTLNKYLHETLPLVEAMIKTSRMPQAEYEIWRTNARQEFEVSNEKVAMRARRAFRPLIYGNHHPYGRLAELDDFDALQLDDVRTFFHARYRSGQCTIIASGMIPAELDRMLNQHFGQADWSGRAEEKSTVPEAASTAQRIHLIEKPDALQSAIRIGRKLFTRSHEDFQSIQVLSTILGGYFGSRLMTNIREDKGYTYGIGSAVTSNQHDGMFFIATQVGSDVTTAALEEIYKELALLRNQAVSAEELELVRNYLLGNLLKSIDGPFALADRWKSVMNFGMDFDYFNRFVAVIKSITSSELQVLANRYLQEEDLIQLVVGKQI